MKRGLLLVISGPSGSGKGTLIKRFSSYSGAKVSISATTRKKRDYEQEGKDYYFFTKEEFKNQLEKGNVVEYNEYCGNFYGTLKSELYRLLDGNSVVILEIDVNGARKIDMVFDCVKIFVLPPSFSVLKERLIFRGTETKKNIDIRLEKALKEIESAYLYDYLVINEKIEDAVLNLKDIVEVEKLRLKNVKDFVDKFLVEANL